MRWNHPELGRLLPDDFIRVAEHTGLVNPLTSFVLDRALARVAAVDAAGDAAASPSTSRRAACITPRSPGRIRDMLESHGVPAASLTLEITENLVMSDPDGAIRCLDELHDMGVRLVIDDFGKGYSSLSYLRRLPVDEIKIDRSFIIGLADGEDDTLVRCMIDLAHNLGMTGDRRRRRDRGGAATSSRELNCDAAQGYFLAKPATAGDIATGSAAAARALEELCTGRRPALSASQSRSD